MFSSLPGDGRYAAGLAMIETENGYAILVRATVEKAGSRDDDDDEPEPDTNTVMGDGFTYDKSTKEATITEAGGLQELFANTTINAASADITLKELGEGETYTITEQLTDNFTGKLKGTSANQKAQITLSGGASLFGTIDGGEVSNLDITVTRGISVSKNNSDANAGAVAGQNYGTITGCDVTISSDKSIEANSSSGSGYAYAGGLVGYNKGAITDCHVTIDGTVSARKSESNDAYAGGLAGYNNGTITDCTVTIEDGGTIQATATSGSASAYAGGIAGYNGFGCGIQGSSQVTIKSDGTITATSGSGFANAGGLVGRNFLGTVTATYSGTGTNTIKAKVGDDEASVPTADGSNTDTAPENATGDEIRASAGTKWGSDESNKPAAHDPNNE